MSDDKKGKTMTEFERGARAATQEMMFYFMNEDENPVIEERVESLKPDADFDLRAVTHGDLESYAEGAVQDALRHEEARASRA